MTRVWYYIISVVSALEACNLPVSTGRWFGAWLLYEFGRPLSVHHNALREETFDIAIFVKVLRSRTARVVNVASLRQNRLCLGEFAGKDGLTRCICDRTQCRRNAVPVTGSGLLDGQRSRFR